MSVGSFDPDDVSVPALARPRRFIPPFCSHSGHMVWVGDPIPDRCWCDSCGQEWVLVFKVNERGARECSGWRPVDPAAPEPPLA